MHIRHLFTATILATLSGFAQAAPASCDLESIEKNLSTVMDALIKNDNQQGEAMMARAEKLIKERKVPEDQAGMFMLGILGDDQFNAQQQKRMDVVSASLKKFTAMKESGKADCVVAEQIATELKGVEQISKNQWEIVNKKIEAGLYPTAEKK